MADSQASPLLGSTERPSSQHSKHSKRSNVSRRSNESQGEEQTPLLSRTDTNSGYNAVDREDEVDDECLRSPAATSLRSLQNGHTTLASTKSRRRWPTIIAIIFLVFVVTTIVAGAFFGPPVIEEYAKQSMVIEPTSLSIHEFTSTGVTARVQALFRMDAARVKNKHVRNIGRFGTWLARKVESEPSKVEVYLPEYGNVLIGTAAVPGITVDIRNGHATSIDFYSALEPGDVEGIRRVANDWLEGRLDNIRVLGKAEVGLKSGLFRLGSQAISESLVFEGDKIPSMPAYNITRLNFREVPVSISGRQGMAADVSLSLSNSYPIALTIPPLSFDILVENCGLNDPYIRLADATTDVIDVKPYADISVDVGGIVRELPKTLLQACPNSKSSPLDTLLSQYIHGNDTTIYVQGSSSPSPDTPEWISSLISSVTVPVPFPGHSFDKMIKSFTLTDAKFKLPGLMSDDEEITISGNIVVLAALPKEMNFGLNVTKVRAAADVFYKGDKLGVLDLKEWQAAESKRTEAKKGEDASLQIEARIDDAPLHITDEDVMNEIVLQYAMGGKIELKVVALVDVNLVTVLGQLVVRDLPAEGVIPVKPLPNRRGIAGLMPQVGNLKILNTGETSLELQALVNFTNPSEYTAEVGYFNIHILNNGSVIGDATIENISVTTGNNTNILVQATWDPTSFGGQKGATIGSELLSQYISGFNTTLTFQTHEGTFLYQPKLGKALSNFSIEIPTPRLSTPSSDGDRGGSGGEEGKPHFIDDATFHILSSTAQFTLLSPLQYSTLYIEHINATAFYNHTEPVGYINYDYPFKVPPGASQSPKLPVQWSLDSVGYDAVKNALGGTLQLDAKGTVGIRLGLWTEKVWYTGRGIGANIRF